LKFGSQYLGKNTRGGAQLAQKCVSRKIERDVEFVLVDFERRAGTNESGINRPQGCSDKIDGESVFKCLQFLGREEQTRTPLGKNCRKLVMVFLSDELVCASLRF
jgi:hypothetical protein